MYNKISLGLTFRQGHELTPENINYHPEGIARGQIIIGGGVKVRIELVCILQLECDNVSNRGRPQPVLPGDTQIGSCGGSESDKS